MNRTTKLFKQQTQIAKSSFSNYNAIETMLHTEELETIIEPYREASRKRLYGPVETVSMFVSQALHPDRSCQNIVNHIALRHEHCSVSTGGYCKARQRLDTTMVKALSDSVAQSNEKRASSSWHWEGRKVYLVDGTTLIMPDTPENQKEYPQTASLKKGLGFPIFRLAGIISLATGSLIDAAVTPFHGKGASEQALLRSLLPHFKAGDIVLADAFYSTYFLIAHMIENHIDIVFAQHGSRTRTTDFSKGTSLGKNDHLITFTKPKLKPDWMDQSVYDASPDSFSVREFKAAGKILITTMLDAQKHSKKVLGNLYKKRWHIEVDLRNLKTTMGLEMLSCKTPEMVIKELWVYFLAYNMIRSLMLASALYTCVLPRLLSFKHTLQLLLAYHCDVMDIETLLMRIAQKQIGNRPDRVEPRVIKRRKNNFPLMMQSRDVLRQEIRKNGHPKKVK